MCQIRVIVDSSTNKSDENRRAVSCGTIVTPGALKDPTAYETASVGIESTLQLMDIRHGLRHDFLTTEVDTRQAGIPLGRNHVKYAPERLASEKFVFEKN